MKITMYELLGLVKDGKAPKKILLNGIAFEYQGDDYLYKDEDKKEHWLFSTSYTDKYIWLENFLKAEVEIIKEDKKIKKLDEILMINDLIPPYGENEYKAWKNIIIQQNKINELIDEINSLKEND